MLLEMRPGCLLGFWLILGIPFICLGIFFLYQGSGDAILQNRFNGRAVEVPATVISSDMLRPVGARSDSASFFPNIEYTYEYKGVVRKSDRVWVVSEADTENAIQALVNKFSEGVQTVAFVDPQSPDLVALEKRWSRMVYVSISIGILPILFVTSIGLLLTGWRWPGAAMAIALFVTLLSVSVVGAATWHCLEYLPQAYQQTWIWLVLSVTGCVSFAPMLSLIKVKQLNGLYLQAQKG